MGNTGATVPCNIIYYNVYRSISMYIKKAMLCYNWKKVPIHCKFLKLFESFTLIVAHWKWKYHLLKRKICNENELNLV